MDLTFEEAKQFLVVHEDLGKVLPKAKHGGLICPCCGSGSGPHGTGMTPMKKLGPGVYKCWREDKIYDAISLRAELNHVSWKDAFRDLCNKYEIHVLHDRTYQPIPRPLKDVQEYQKDFIRKTAEEQKEVPVSVLQADMKDAEENLGKTPYLTKRGLSMETQKAFHCGYLSGWIHPMYREAVEKGEKYIRPTNRVIIPTSDHSYIARLVGDNGLKKMKAGKDHQFCWDKMKDWTKPILVVEGEIDAMSVYEVGHKETVALGSTNFMEKFFSYIDTHIEDPTKLCFFVSLDDDEAGKLWTGRFLQEAEKRKIPTVDLGASILLDGTKDANASLVKDREAFSKTIRNAFREAFHTLMQKRQQALEASCRKEAADRFEAIQQAGRQPRRDTPQDVFRGFLAEGMKENIFSYVSLAVEKARAAHWTESQIKTGISKTAPGAAYDPLHKERPYADRIFHLLPAASKKR